MKWIAPFAPLARPTARFLGRFPRLKAMAQLAPPRPKRVALPELTPGAGHQARPRRLPAGLRAARLLRQRQRGDGRRAGRRGLRGLGAGQSRAAAARCSCTPGIDARDEARETIAAFEGCDTIVVNAAGCGSAMKDYGHLFRDDPEWSERAAAFSAKVRDVHELLAEHEPQAARHPVDLVVAYHDACHLAHAQGVRAQPRALLQTIPGLDAARARRVGAVLRLGRRLEPAQPRAGGRARPAQGPQPARHRRAGRRRRQPRLRAADRRPRRAARPSPDGAARRLDPRKEAMTVDVLAPAPAAGVLTDDALAFLGALHERFEPRRRELLDARAQRRARIAAGETLDFLPDTRDIREGDWQVAAAPRRPTGPARRDHRPRRPQDGHQRAELGRARVHGRLRGLAVADVGQRRRGPGQPDRRDRGHDRVHRRRRARVQARRRGGDAARAPARLAPGREARARRRRAGRGRLRRRRALPHAQRPAPAREGLGPVLLPAQDGVAPRGAAVGRGLRLHRGRAGARPRDGQDDGAHRDAARRLRDGGDPLRAARALVLAERGPLGLHLLDDQDLPRAARSSSCPTATT